MISLIHGLKKTKQTKQIKKQTHRYREQMGGYQRGGGGELGEIGEDD